MVIPKSFLLRFATLGLFHRFHASLRKETTATQAKTFMDIKRHDNDSKDLI